MTSAQLPRRDLLYRLLRPKRRTAILDVGANPIDGEPPYKEMLAKRLCSVVGFEPQAEALCCVECPQKRTGNVPAPRRGRWKRRHPSHHPGLGHDQLVEPNPNALECFGNFSKWGAVIKTEPVTTHRLDDLMEIKALDLLKIDVQGSELAVFKGASRLLDGAVAVHTEVSFIPLYKNQPAFGDVDLELRAHGLIPHCFAAINRRII